MIDDETLLLLNAYIDDELSPAETLAMERRLRLEPELRAHLEAMVSMSRRLQGALAGDDVPEERMRSRAVSAIGFAETVAPETPRRFWLAIAATLVIGIGLGYLASEAYSPWSVERADMTDVLLAAHLRGLAVEKPFDMASSDRHVVKPWFNGRTTLAPKAPDLSADGFPLAGGRIDVVGLETVPTMVYTRRRHVISVTAVPADSGLPAGEQTRAGTNILRWVAGNLEYVAVSDLNIGELRAFAERFRAAP